MDFSPFPHNPWSPARPARLMHAQIWPCGLNAGVEEGTGQIETLCIPSQTWKKNTPKSGCKIFSPISILCFSERQNGFVKIKLTLTICLQDCHSFQISWQQIRLVALWNVDWHLMQFFSADLVAGTGWEWEKTWPNIWRWSTFLCVG